MRVVLLPKWDTLYIPSGLQGNAKWATTLRAKAVHGSVNCNPSLRLWRSKTWEFSDELSGCKTLCACLCAIIYGDHNCFIRNLKESVSHRKKIQMTTKDFTKHHPIESSTTGDYWIQLRRTENRNLLAWTSFMCPDRRSLWGVYLILRNEQFSASFSHAIYPLILPSQLQK